MAKHLNPLEKEFLIRRYRSNQRISIKDFCESNGFTDSSLKKWMKQYDEGGLEGLVPGILPLVIRQAGLDALGISFQPIIHLHQPDLIEDILRPAHDHKRPRPKQLRLMPIFSSKSFSWRLLIHIHRKCMKGKSNSI
ncbi:MAG: helix-turn-helix domain-containing protein [Bacteroidales bacterium]|nr:helix-turn-helix domain-containing protein [Bacteroidales bacterium]